jgi:hypothetical protein
MFDSNFNPYEELQELRHEVMGLTSQLVNLQLQLHQTLMTQQELIKTLNKQAGALNTLNQRFNAVNQ